MDAAGNTPAWCLFENFAGHVSMGLDTVLSDLEAADYAAWPLVIPACAVNAPHRRDRVWILANSNNSGKQKRHLAAEPIQKGQHCRCGVTGYTANTSRKLPYRAGDPRQAGRNEFANCCSDAANSNSKRELQQERLEQNIWERFGNCREWTTESPVCGPDDGISDRVARLKALGNAVVPQIPELIGRAIMATA
jgi:DNA (cytosine-5)-methyltransferase 1